MLFVSFLFLCSLLKSVAQSVYAGTPVNGATEIQQLTSNYINSVASYGNVTLAGGSGLIYLYSRQRDVNDDSHFYKLVLENSYNIGTDDITYIAMYGSYVAAVEASNYAVYCFTLSGTVLTLSQVIANQDPSSRYVDGLAMYDNSLFISNRISHSIDDDYDDDYGSINVYSRAAGTWSLSQSIPTLYVSKLAVWGTNMLYKDEASGLVYMGSYSNSVWSINQGVVPVPEGWDDDFGYAITMEGNTAVFGNPFADDLNRGLLLFYTYSNGVWTLNDDYFLEGDLSMYLGGSVSLSGTYLTSSTYTGNVIFYELSLEMPPAPTLSPSESPTESPSAAPTLSPSESPSVSPSAAPTSNYDTVTGSTLLQTLHFPHYYPAGIAFNGSTVLMSNTDTRLFQYHFGNNVLTQTTQYDVSSILACAMYENIVAIGPDNHDAYVSIYHVSSEAFALTQTIDSSAANDNGAINDFGFAISLYNTTLMIGDYSYNDGDGGVWVYTKVGHNFQSVGMLEFDASLGNYFGYSIGMYGENCLVSFDQYYPATGQVAVYKNVNAEWTYQSTLTAPSVTSIYHDGRMFGCQISIYGTVAAISQTYSTDEAGAIYFYSLKDDAWIEDDYYLTGSINEQLGTAMAIYDGIIIAGTTNYSVNVYNLTIVSSSGAAIAPTHYPSIRPITSTTFKFTATQVLSGITASEFTVDDNVAIFAATVQQYMPDSTADFSLTIVEVVNVMDRRLLVESDKRDLTSTDSIEVEYAILFSSASLSTATAVLSSFTTSISAAIADGSFNSELHTQSLKYPDSPMQSVSSSSIIVSGSVETVTDDDDDADGDEKKNNLGLIVGGAVGGGVGLLLIGLLVYYFMRRSSSPSSESHPSSTGYVKGNTSANNEVEMSIEVVIASESEDKVVRL